ncbi:MAG: carbohydrate kinase family protein [Patescibacteria group bacterium]|nr:carbohydrate kinase family protein [Patescibacteria group bacterium]
MAVEITTIGSATRDIFLVPEQVKVIKGDKVTCQQLMAFEYGAKIQARELRDLVGGTAVNVSVGLERQGIEAAAYLAVGDDEAGKKVIDVLDREGVSRSLVEQKKGAMTDVSLIIIDKGTGERTIFLKKGAGREKDIDWKKITSQCVYLSSLRDDWGNKIKIAGEFVKNSSRRLFFTPAAPQIQAGMEKMKDFLNKVEVIFMNEDEALEFSGQKEKIQIGRMIKEIWQAGPKVAVITKGDQGVYFYQGKETGYAPSRKVSAKDVTGAGDAFVSGFLAKYLRGAALKEAAENGIDNAVSVIQKIGAIQGLIKSKDKDGK